MHLTMAWRNIWRNRRRTGIILAAVVLGVWSMIVIAALSRGMVATMLENGKATLTGDLQIHAAGYRLDPSIENRMTEPSTARKALKRALPPDAGSAERIRVSAVVSNARQSAGVTLVGIHPDQEKGLSFIGRPLRSGSPLKSDDRHGILVGRALLEDLETGIGKKLVVMSRDTTGEIASRAFTIQGVFTAEMEGTQKQFVFVSIAAAGDMLAMGGAISEISVGLPESLSSGTAADAIRKDLPADAFEVHTWQQLLPMLTSYLEMFDGFMLVWFLVIFIAMGFGIVNTLLMAVMERVREYGLLKALGMKPRGILASVVTESGLLLGLGVVTGNLLALASVAVLARTGVNLSAMAEGAEYFGISRVIYPALLPGDMASADGIVILLGIVVALYPAVKAARFTPVEAMRIT